MQGTGGQRLGCRAAEDASQLQARALSRFCACSGRVPDVAERGVGGRWPSRAVILCSSFPARWDTNQEFVKGREWAGSVFKGVLGTCVQTSTQ